MKKKLQQMLKKYIFYFPYLQNLYVQKTQLSKKENKLQQIVSFHYNISSLYT